VGFRIRLRPEETFPDNLVSLDDQDLHVLHSRIVMQFDAECLKNGRPHLETESRLEELVREFERRESMDATGIDPAATPLA
jgi:hypothetical protein